MNLDKELKLLESKKNKLEKKDIDLIISDFDDTIFSTYEVLQKDARKGRRGDEGNKYILDVIGVDFFIEEYYTNRSFPDTIISKMNKTHDLILTAGEHEIQTKKMIATGTDSYNHIVVDHGIDKILETIKYVVNELEFIPSKITVYEDRTHFFEEHRILIQEFLGTKLEIMYVEMKDNDSEPQIKKID